jgi:CheY-like chemotaxis protein
MQNSNSRQTILQASQACAEKSVLLIDTDETNHLLHQIYLSKYKIELLYSKSLRHAIWLAQEQPPDLILTDIYFNGHLHYEHLFHLRQEKIMPIVVQTSQLPQLHKENCIVRGAEAYFTKPIDWHQYLTLIIKCLTRNPPNQ